MAMCLDTAMAGGAGVDLPAVAVVVGKVGGEDETGVVAESREVHPVPLNLGREGRDDEDGRGQLLHHLRVLAVGVGQMVVVLSHRQPQPLPQQLGRLLSSY